ncbi:MAG: hypothetical protein PHP95_06815 [Desulfuromonadaceae bacterium]|nr:hypothetical protein [Desulfuromonadaceae bacterium]MDD2848153.1 hypothetical protein [Desulfuromonadaceae bacterium]MDD4132006.1 hypothetical protein [Desulfuromonadaceae bacterium]
MQSFRTIEEIEQAGLNPKIRRAVMRAMRGLLAAYGEGFDPVDDGYVVLVDQHTTDADALELIGRSWPDVRLEGATFDRETNCFLTVWLANNQFGLSIVVPDEPWLDPRFRAVLLSELGGQNEQ